MAWAVAFCFECAETPLSSKYSDESESLSDGFSVIEAKNITN